MSTALGRAVVQALISSGVRHVVIAPGSRSAPLVLALHEAEQVGLVTLHVRFDERAAAFLALGLGLRSGEPAAVVCTSGSAVANLMPAALEADYAGAPLLLVTADRPPELHGIGANQTVEQVNYFAKHHRFAIDLGPELAPDTTDLVKHAVEAAATGPVHLNVRFREPLVPEDDDRWTPEAPALPTCEGFGTPVVGPGLASALRAAGLGEIPANCLVIVGHLSPRDPSGQDALALALEFGWPVIAEPTSGILGHGLDPRVGSAPELVLTVGRVGLDRTVARLVREAKVHVAVPRMPESHAPDPERLADLVLDTVPYADAPAHPATGEWLDRWQSAEPPRLSPAAALAREMWTALPEGSLLHVAASTSVRALMSGAVGLPRRVTVVGNRGASGIDGLVSTAWGAALAHEAPSYALLGDVAFLYDHGGLVRPRRSGPEPDLTYVVLDDGQGGLFGRLEYGQPRFDSQRDLFTTPHDVDVAAVARAAGWPVQGFDALGTPWSGVRVIRAIAR